MLSTVLSASRQLLEPVHLGPRYDLAVAAAEDGHIRLPVSVDGLRDALFGVQWRGGYGQSDRVLKRRDGEVLRSFRSLTGGRPQPGEGVTLSVYAWPPDPRSAYGLDYREVRVRSPLGELPAWEVPAAGDVWAVFAHGRGATCEEALRILPTLRSAGLTTLAVSYRNDRGAPASPDGLCHLGASEWLDVQAACEHARERGALAVVLVGYSMGGAIVCHYLRHGERTLPVLGAILDAPVLDWNATLALAARLRGISRTLAAAAKRAAAVQARLSFADLDQVAHAGEFDVPILLFHGDADATVPFATSAAFAAARPDLVRLERVAGAGHVQAWNYAPARYERRVSAFLEHVLERQP